MTDQELGEVVRESLAHGGLRVETLTTDERRMFVADLRQKLYQFGRDYPMALGALREMQRA